MSPSNSGVTPDVRLSHLCRCHPGPPRSQRPQARIGRRIHAQDKLKYTRLTTSITVTIKHHDLAHAPGGNCSEWWAASDRNRWAGSSESASTGSNDYRPSSKGRTPKGNPPRSHRTVACEWYPKSPCNHRHAAHRTGFSASAAQSPSTLHPHIQHNEHDIPNTACLSGDTLHQCVR